MTANKIILDEIKYWRAKEAEAPPGEKYKFGGAVCCLLGFKDGVTLETLREEYSQKGNRSKTAEFKDMAFDILARNRAVYAAKAIKKLGIRLKALDKPQA